MSDREKMKVFQEKLYKVVLDIDEPNHEMAMMQAAVLLKTAIEMYTYLFKENEDVEHMLEVGKGTISKIRKNNSESPTVH